MHRLWTSCRNCWKAPCKNKLYPRCSYSCDLTYTRFDHKSHFRWLTLPLDSLIAPPNPPSILLLSIILQSGAALMPEDVFLSLSFLHEYSSEPRLDLHPLCYLSLLVTPAICPAVVLQVPLKPINGARNKFIIWQKWLLNWHFKKMYALRNHADEFTLFCCSSEGWRGVYAHSCPRRCALISACMHIDILGVHSGTQNMAVMWLCALFNTTHSRML